jgi:hypothetical protein
MEAELPEEKIAQAVAFYKLLGVTAKAGFKSALANCRCHICDEILSRVNHEDLR